VVQLVRVQTFWHSRGFERAAPEHVLAGRVNGAAMSLCHCNRRG
jgi:hypothetical protein